MRGIRFELGALVRTADGRIGEIVSYGYGIAIPEPEYGVRCSCIDHTVEYHAQSTLKRAPLDVDAINADINAVHRAR